MKSASGLTFELVSMSDESIEKVDQILELL